MKGLGLILTLFTITVLFTQCRYDDTCGGGDSSSPKKEITGMTGFYTEFFGDSMSPTILISADYSYAISKPHFNFINSAIACSPAIQTSDFGPWIDSIRVLSIPNYNDTPLETQIEITNVDHTKFLLSDFNNYTERNFNVASYMSETLRLLEKPTLPDTFAFSFYYYKGGAIIDSSFTQRHYISN